jgi:RNA polymerase-interacting CarD/CdnL/TRCF family regulator
MPQDYFIKKAAELGRSDAHEGKSRETIGDPTKIANVVTMFFNYEVQRDMTKDEQKVYNSAKADETNRIGQKS